MREILFRGKCGYNNEWVEGFYYQAKLYRSDKELCHYITIPHPESDGQPSDHIMVHSETVGQFTGLTDKNGKRIFEGDIAKNEYEDRNYQYFKIFYNEKTLQWEVMNKYGMRGNLHNVIGNMEVIGNIHDNPELLENP